MAEEGKSTAATSGLSAQEQARIRRERRQAKVREGGSSRLSRITATQGTDFRREELEAAKAASTSPPPSTRDHHADPPEVDISRPSPRPSVPPRPSALQQHAAAHFTSTTSPEDEIRQAMMLDQLYRPRGSPGSTPNDTPGLGEGQDPLMQLLQQISGAGGFPSVEGMENIMGGASGAGGMGGSAQAVESKGDRWGMWWTVLHALSAFMLAIWALRSHPGVFDGSEMMRVESANVAASEKPQLFRYFALMELLLQSGRFLVEKGRPPQGSMLTTIAGFLPLPFSTYLSTLARYSVFLWTILQDAGVVIFVLGMAAWWNSS
ncbi:hypothetical protein FN846DRAFT_907498 [Sphaerosporella brunnea]|uniref:GET complex, subunit GET2 n=1 Tax=Sphaerosporella brunnea TaxID=1250544 RepID=A0A5J5EW56_9PEZI|nr:hypothetical protein FN846DRAFT_907498 [Sphaerosporella brunnea]